MRDDFSKETIDLLAKRVGFKCSNPSCQLLTSGPRQDPSKSVNIGVAAHIAAAASGGPRYNSSMSSDERKAASNGIWLCQKCAKLVDNDPVRYDTNRLREWREIAENRALRELEGKGNVDVEATIVGQKSQFERLEKLMPELLAEMRDDLAEAPLRRELILMSNKWVYNESADRRVFRYYFETHPELLGIIKILENYGLVTDITYNSVSRYTMSEDLVEYLTQQ